MAPKPSHLHRSIQFKGRKPFISVLALMAPLVVLFHSSDASGRPNIRDAFFAVYPNAVGSPIDTVPSHPVHCGVCHYSFNGGGPRNPYGVRVGQVIGGFPNTNAGRQQAVMSIQSEDPDGDGFSTLTEATDEINYVNTPTFPGLTPANVGSVSNVLLTEIQGYLVPMTGVDTTPPVVAVVTPNGGQTATGNAAITVQWTATDSSGIARIDILLSDDNGATYHPLVEGLSQSGGGGSRLVYIPNRPTAQASIRVTAVDNAGNTASDSSNAVFSVVSPAGGTVPTTLRDFDLPGTLPFDAEAINAPSACAACHGNYDAAVEPHFNWQGSMMAQASRDLLFEACMTIGNQDAPDSGDLCLRCHLPSGWLRGRSIPTTGTEMTIDDMQGVSCDLCHRLVDPIPDPLNPAIDASILAALASAPTTFGNGMYVVDPQSGNRRGPFADAVAPHTALVSPFHREAALCGTCHDVSNPAFTRDENDNYPPNALNTPASNFSAHSLMPIERTYSEWLYSAYNTPEGVYAPQFGGNQDYVASCQDCHMRAITGKGCNDPAAPTRNDLPLHDMTGGSTWLPGLLATLYPGQVDEAALEAGILRARYMLQNAATLYVEQEVSVLEVRVTNETGHKLPTGYPEGRRVWINVKFLDAGMTLLSESAAYDPATGILSHDPQAKIYEAEPGLDADTAALVGVPPGPSFHFVLNNKIYKDNRIPPRGFTNVNFALFGGTPVGATYADGQYWDDTVYAIPYGATQAVVTLYYQSTSKEFVEFLRDENTTNTKGQELYNLWANNNRCPPEVMATTTLALVAVPLPGDIDGDGDVDTFDAGLLADVLIGADTDPAHISRSDLNDDETADGLDVQPFVNEFMGALMLARS